jgi:hypothetical protein
MRERAQFASPDVFDRRRRGTEVELHMPGKQISKRRRPAAIEHVPYVDLEQFRGHMTGTPDPPDAMLSLPAFALA